MHFLSDVLFAVVSSLFRITVESKQKQPWERQTVSSVRKVWEIGVKITVFTDWWEEIRFGLDFSAEITKNQGRWRIQGRGWGARGPGPSLFFGPNWGPKGWEKFLLRLSPPSYLRVAWPPPPKKLPLIWRSGSATEGFKKSGLYGRSKLRVKPVYKRTPTELSRD